MNEANYKGEIIWIHPNHQTIREFENLKPSPTTIIYTTMPDFPEPLDWLWMNAAFVCKTWWIQTSIVCRTGANPYTGNGCRSI
jgi:hypothetical protein